jgi:hypothetical protein
MSTLNRPPVRQGTKEMTDENAKDFQANEDGKMVSPNKTGQIVGDDAQYGHRAGFENRAFVANAEKAGYTQPELNRVTNNAGLYQKEPAKENMSGKFEEKDPNQSNLNTFAYMASEDKELASRTYINIDPNSKQGHLSVANKETGVESKVGDFSLGESNKIVCTEQGATNPTVMQEQKSIQKEGQEPTAPKEPPMQEQKNIKIIGQEAKPETGTPSNDKSELISNNIDR